MNPATLQTGEIRAPGTAMRKPPLRRPMTGDRSAAIVVGAIIAVVLMQAVMVFTRAVNWDEFWFYVLIDQYRHGQLLQPLQTFHVRLFGWLAELPGNNLDHILMARLLMLGCEVATIASIAVIARRFVEWPAALLAALAYVSAGFVMQHGFSFRTDPVATACLMGALAVLVRSRLDAKWIAAFAVLVGLAAIVTIKVVLYAPVFAGLAWLRWSEAGLGRAMLIRLALAGAASVAAFALFYLWHASGLPAAGNAGGTAVPKSAAGWVFFLGVPPYFDMIGKAIATAPILAIAIACAPVAIWKSSLDRAEKIALTGCWLPALSPAFYINTAAYFYVFMLAPVAVACAVPLAMVGRRYGHALAAALLMAMAVMIFVKEDRTIIEWQRLLIEEAQGVFPTRVAYFDLDGMIPVHDKANWLMTPSTVANYQAAGEPSFLAAMNERPVPLLLNNWDGFDAILTGADKEEYGGLLLPEDEAALKNNYVHLWGPLWVAGRDVPAAGKAGGGDWLIPGAYRIGSGPVVIDGRRHEPGDIVRIARGPHDVRSLGTASRIIWADAKRPSRNWDEGELYELF